MLRSDLRWVLEKIEIRRVLTRRSLTKEAASVLLMLACVLAGLFVPVLAAASTGFYAETRVGGLDLGSPDSIRAQRAVTLGTQQGYAPAYDDLASRSLLAASGGAESAAQGARLNQHLRQLETYGQAGSRELSSGRIRYYGELDAATKPGEMAGRRLVREWDPATGATRTWHETLDASGTVRIVRPETGGPKVHYLFDKAGNYVGRR